MRGKCVPSLTRYMQNANQLRTNCVASMCRVFAHRRFEWIKGYLYMCAVHSGFVMCGVPRLVSPIVIGAQK